MTTLRSIATRVGSAARRKNAPAMAASFDGCRHIPAHTPGDVTRCHHCGHTGIVVGRVTAECGGCGMPMILQKALINPRQPAPPRMSATAALLDWAKEMVRL